MWRHPLGCHARPPWRGGATGPFQPPTSQNKKPTDQVFRWWEHKAPAFVTRFRLSALPTLTESYPLAAKQQQPQTTHVTGWIVGFTIFRLPECASTRKMKRRRPAPGWLNRIDKNK